jgi:hypothetical protein
MESGEESAVRSVSFDRESLDDGKVSARGDTGALETLEVVPFR